VNGLSKDKVVAAAPEVVDVDEEIMARLDLLRRRGYESIPVGTRICNTASVYISILPYHSGTHQINPYWMVSQCLTKSIPTLTSLRFGNKKK